MDKKIIEEIVNGPSVIQIIDKSLVGEIRKELSLRYDYVQEIIASDELAEGILKAARIHTYHGSGMGKSKTVAVVVSDSSGLPVDIIKYLRLDWADGITDFGSTAWNVDKLLLVDERPQFLLFAEAIEPKELGILKGDKVQPAVTPLNRFLLYHGRARKLIDDVKSPIWFSGIIDGSGEDIYQEILNCWFEMKIRIAGSEHALAEEKYKELQKILLDKVNQYGFRVEDYIETRAKNMKKEYKEFGDNFSGIGAWSFTRSAENWARYIRSMFFFNSLIGKNTDRVSNKEAADAISSVCQSVTELISEINPVPKHNFKTAEEVALSITD